MNDVFLIRSCRLNSHNANTTIRFLFLNRPRTYDVKKFSPKCNGFDLLAGHNGSNSKESLVEQQTFGSKIIQRQFSGQNQEI